MGKKLKKINKIISYADRFNEKGGLIVSGIGLGTGNVPLAITGGAIWGYSKRRRKRA